MGETIVEALFRAELLREKVRRLRILFAFDGLRSISTVGTLVYSPMVARGFDLVGKSN
jgi:hypothetical protein